MATRISPEPGPGPRDPDGGAPPDWLPPAAAAWIAERLEILAARRSALLVAAGAVVLLGLVGALLAPSLIPPRPLVGAAVGFAAVVLGVAAAIAVDSADLIVRGPRHVRAAGADLLGVLPEKPSPETAAELVGPLVAAGADRQAVGVAAASRHVTRTRAWADALGLALAEAGRRVVVADLTSRSEPGEAGVLEVVEDGRRLAEVVDIHPELSLARVGAGADHGAALQALAGVFPRLPRDIEVLLVALPPVASPAVLGAAASLDQVVVLAQTDITSRVDLIATLDAVDAIGAGTEVLLLDSRLHLAANGAGQPPPADAPPGTDGDAPAIDADGAAPDESVAEASTDQASTDQASTDQASTDQASAEQASADEDTAAATDTAADAATDRDVDAPQDQDAEASQRQDTDAATDEDTDAATEEDAPAPATDAAPDATATGEATGAAGTDQDVADVAAEAEADEGTSPAPPLESGAGDADDEPSASAAIEPDRDVGGATVVAPTPVQPVLLTDDDWAARVISREPLLPHVPDTAAPAGDTPEPAPDTAEPAPDTAEPAADTAKPAPDTVEPAPDTAQVEGATEVGPDDDIEGTDEIPRVRAVPGPPAAPPAPADPAAPVSHAPAHQGAAHPPDRAAPPAPPESAQAAPASPAPNGASPSGEPPGTPPTDAVALDDLDDLDERDEQGEGGEIRSLAAIDALNRQLEDRQLESRDHGHGHDHDRGRDREHDRELGR